MMASWNETIFRDIGPLWGESNGDKWIPLTKDSDAELWRFLWYALIKSILRLNSRTHNSMIYAETGTWPISYHIKSRMINFLMCLLNV